jgi:hypothetical protein
VIFRSGPNKALSWWSWFAIGLPFGALITRTGDIYFWIVDFAFRTPADGLFSLVIVVVLTQVVASIAMHVFIAPFLSNREKSFEVRAQNWIAMGVGMLVGVGAALAFVEWNR